MLHFQHLAESWTSWTAFACGHDVTDVTMHDMVDFRVCYKIIIFTTYFVLQSCRKGLLDVLEIEIGDRHGC